MSRTPGYQPKIRNANNRKRKSVILLATEGKNKTETLYFDRLPNNNCVIHYAPGNYTDPVNMINALKMEYDYLELDPTLGDAAYCLIDGDLNQQKDKQIAQADVEAGKRIKVIVSNPCFEIWFLCHFIKTTKHFSSNKEVIKALNKYIPNYCKNMENIWDEIGDKTKLAIANAEALEQFYLNNGFKKHTSEFVPSTEVYHIVEYILKL